MLIFSLDCNGNGFCALFLTENHDNLAKILPRNLLERMPDQEPGIAVFTRQ